MEKIFILTTDTKDMCVAYKLATYISSKYDLDIAKTFTSSFDIDVCKDNKEHFMFFDVNDMVIAYKNNAMLYCLSESEKSIGIAIDEYYNNDIFCMSVEAFNNISESLLVNIFVIWIDSKSKNLDTNTINNAKILLLNTNLAINEIAEQCGFCDASYFTLLFKKSFKITPKEYRANKNSSYNNNP